jgi:hypothetical protein
MSHASIMKKLMEAVEPMATPPDTQWGTDGTSQKPNWPKWIDPTPKQLQDFLKSENVQGNEIPGSIYYDPTTGGSLSFTAPKGPHSTSLPPNEVRKRLGMTYTGRDGQQRSDMQRLPESKFAFPCPKCGNPVDDNGDSKVGPKGALMHKVCGEKKSVSEATDKKCPKCKKTKKSCTCKDKKKSVKESADNMNYRNLALDLSELHQNMLEEIDQAEQMLRRTPFYNSAKSYWIGHIKTALGSDEYDSRFEQTMEKTINKIKAEGGDGDDEDMMESKKVKKKSKKKIDESIDPALVADGVVGAAVAFILKKVSDPAKAVEVADMILDKLKSKIGNGI